MIHLHLARWAYIPAGTFGRLTTTIDGTSFSAVTLEPHWLHNWENLSCIPAGVYDLKRATWTDSQTITYPTLEVVVPGRTGILIHPLNLLHETCGCIGVGTHTGLIDGKWGIQGSRAAFQALMSLVEPIPADTFMHLAITDCLGGPPR